MCKAVIEPGDAQRADHAGERAQPHVDADGTGVPITITAANTSTRLTIWPSAATITLAWCRLARPPK